MTRKTMKTKGVLKMTRKTMKTKVRRLQRSSPARGRKVNWGILAAILMIFVLPLIMGPAAAMGPDHGGGLGLLTLGLLAGTTAAATGGGSDVLTQLAEKRTAKIGKMKEISKKADQTDEDIEQFDALEAEVRSIDERIKRIQKVAKLASLTIPRAQITDPGKPGDPGGSATPVLEDPSIGMTDKEIRRYSICKALLAAADRNWERAGLELEASRAMAEKVGKDCRGADAGNGFMIPHDVAVKGIPVEMLSKTERETLAYRYLRHREHRALNIAGDGSNIIATQLGSMIELLRNQMVLQNAGAIVLPDLIGTNIAFPRHTGGAAVVWVGEGVNVSETTPTIDQVALAAKTAGAFTDITRQLLKQSSIDVELFVRQDLMRSLGLEVDFQGLHGLSGGDNPVGVGGTTGINTVEFADPDGGAPTWPLIVQLETEVAVDNAAIGNLSYITNPKVRGKLKSVEKAANTGLFLWNDNAGRTPVNGYPCLVSNQVRSDLTKGAGTNLSAIFFGNWADLFIGLWGGMDVLVDQYTGGLAGTLRIIIHQDVGVAVRHPVSFCLADDVVTT